GRPPAQAPRAADSSRAPQDRPSSPATPERQHGTNSVDVFQRHRSEVPAVPAPSGLDADQPDFAGRHDRATPRTVRYRPPPRVAHGRFAVGETRSVYGMAVQLA